MLKFFVLDPDSDNTEVVIDNDSTEMEYQVILADIPKVPVPEGTNELVLDWEDMVDGPNAFANKWLTAQITEVVIARYDMSLKELEEEFLFLEELADGWWSGEVIAGESIDLDTLVDEDGEEFEGVEDDGATWIAAAFCRATCNNPAPWSITVLKPCS